MLCSLGVLPGVAQTIRGTLTGSVTDTTGAVLPGAMVTVTNNATGIKETAVTNSQGSYTIPLLSSGTYRATVELQGFKKYLRDGIVVQIAQTTRLDLVLQVGAVNEAVQVIGESPLVRSNTAELGQVIEMKQIQSLPLNGRFFEHLITMSPGAMPFYSRGDSAENASAAGARIATAHSVNGMPWSGNNYLLDGVVNNEPQNAYINITPPLEAIQEFKVQTNNPTAEFGVFGGAAVNLSIRSGTNDIQGSVFDYIRDDSMNARSYFALTKAPYNSNQFGGTLGGPIVKNRAFFFGDYQGLKLHQGRTATLTVPTALMRQGIFSEVANQIFDPLTGVAFEGNIIRSDRLNPISQQVANTIYPMPTQPGLANNYVENIVLAQRVNAGDARVDYKFKGGASLFGRYSESARTYDDQSPANMFMGNGASPATNNSTSSNRNGVVGYTRAIGFEQVLRAARRLQPVLHASVRRRFRSGQEQPARHPERQPRGLSRNVWHRQLSGVGLQQHRVARDDQRRARWTNHPHHEQSVVADRQAFDEVRRGPEALQGRRDKSADAAAGPVHVRRQLHEPCRRRGNRVFVRELHARVSDPHPAGRAVGHVIEGNIQENSRCSSWSILVSYPMALILPSLSTRLSFFVIKP
jgi:hypothetical protein